MYACKYAYMNIYSGMQDLSNDWVRKKFFKYEIQSKEREIWT